MDQSFECWLNVPRMRLYTVRVLCVVSGPTASKWLHTHFYIMPNKYVTKKVTRCFSVYNYVFVLIPKYSANPIQKMGEEKKKISQFNFYMVNRMHFYMANLNCLVWWYITKIFTLFSTDEGLPRAQRRILPHNGTQQRAVERVEIRLRLINFLNWIFNYLPSGKDSFIIFMGDWAYMYVWKIRLRFE